jgi:hypothetical protein
MPLLARQIVTTAVWVVIWLIIFNIAGVVVSFAVDILVARHKSMLLFYAVWFVLGVFCGMIQYQQSVERLTKEMADQSVEERPEDEIVDEEEVEEEKTRAALRPPRISAAVTAGVILIVISLCYRFAWGGQGDVFVPDNVGLSLTYFGAVLGSTLFAYKSGL